ncbi:MAG TPA: hypothetical protein VK420_11910 [Longimicrobium sp.]|nr:hypothetical protein [Longimicrobium sp.]
MAPHSFRLTCLLLIGLLGTTTARAEPLPPEEEVKRRYQGAACASVAGWVQVRYGGAFLEVRCNSRAQPPPARVAAAATPARKAQHSPEGYQKARWGMTKSDLKRRYPGLRGRKNVLWYPTTVAGYRAVTSFHFRDNALIRVIVAFRPRGGEKGEPDCFDHVRDALIEKYGAPLPEEGISAWETEETRIELVHNTAAVINRLTATYVHKGSPPPDEEEEPEPTDDRGL